MPQELLDKGTGDKKTKACSTLSKERQDMRDQKIKAQKDYEIIAIHCPPTITLV